MKTILFTMMTLIFSVSVSAQLNPDFSPNHDIETCGPTDVYFVCTAPQGADNIWWDFGDGTTATGLTPIHNYSTTGTYDVKMIVEKGGVKDSITKTGFVMIKPAPQAAFILDTSLVAPPPFRRKFLFTGFSNADSISEYLWTINDAVAQGGEILNYTFPENGDYKIGLVITNNKGCSDEFIDTITIADSPEQPAGIGETPKEKIFYVSTLYDQSQLLIRRNELNGERAEIKVRDISGKLIMSVTMSEGSASASVSLAGLSSGTYYAECLTKTYIAVKRFSIVML